MAGIEALRGQRAQIADLEARRRTLLGHARGVGRGAAAGALDEDVGEGHILDRIALLPRQPAREARVGARHVDIVETDAAALADRRPLGRAQAARLVDEQRMVARLAHHVVRPNTILPGHADTAPDTATTA